MKKALLIIDVQNDFLPGGPLAVPESDQILPKINELQKLPFDLIIATKDWHPKNHSSFQNLWPVHCVQNTLGAELSSKLHQKKIDKIILKGTLKEIDSYSAFFDNEHLHQTELDAYLKEHHILELVIVGVATDYCVKYSCLDALDLGYTVFVAKDGCQALSKEIESLKEMSAHGAKIVTIKEVTTLF